MLQINTDPVGKGKERACFVHPDDSQKAIKISHGDTSEQSRREIRFYQKLQKRGGGGPHIPRFDGLCDSNLDRGIVDEMLRQQDGEISHGLNSCLTEGHAIESLDRVLA